MSQIIPPIIVDFQDYSTRGDQMSGSNMKNRAVEDDIESGNFIRKGE